MRRMWLFGLAAPMPTATTFQRSNSLSRPRYSAMAARHSARYQAKAGWRSGAHVRPNASSSLGVLL